MWLDRTDWWGFEKTFGAKVWKSSLFTATHVSRSSSVQRVQCEVYPKQLNSVRVRDEAAIRVWHSSTDFLRKYVKTFVQSMLRVANSTVLAVDLLNIKELHNLKTWAISYLSWLCCVQCLHKAWIERVTLQYCSLSIVTVLLCNCVCICIHSSSIVVEYEHVSGFLWTRLWL